MFGFLRHEQHAHGLVTALPGPPPDDNTRAQWFRIQRIDEDLRTNYRSLTAVSSKITHRGG